MKISYKLLCEQYACKYERDKFADIFGKDAEVEITEALCLKYAGDFDWRWAARYLLPGVQRHRAYEAMTQADDSYNKACDEADKVYLKATDPERKEYERVLDKSDGEYVGAVERERAGKALNRASNTALIECDKAIAKADKAHDEARALMFWRLVEESND